MATPCFAPSNRSGRHSQLAPVVSTTTTTTTSATTPPSPLTIPTTSTTHQSLVHSATSHHPSQISCVAVAHNAGAGDVVTSASTPLSLTKVILPAEVVVTHQLQDQQQQQQQQSVLFQALTSHSASHFIALVPPGQEGNTLELQSAQTVPCVQYINEDGASNIFTAPNGHITTYSTYNQPEQPNMYTPHSSAYYNPSTNSAENYTSVNVVNGSSGPVNGPIDNAAFSEQADIFNGIDENSLTDQEGASVSSFSSSRLSAATMKWLMENYEMAEGLSVPRGTMYNHYLKHCDECKMEPLNAASFGKLIRSVFNGLRTRRLGTRGNSKYHYYGIRLRPCANIENTENVVGSNLNSNPFGRIRRSKPELPIKLEKNDDRSSVSSTDRENHRCGSSSPEKHQIYLGDASTALPSVEIEINSCSLPEGITMEHVRQFRALYREHCETFLDSVVSFQFGIVESLWHSFWKRSDNESELEHNISKYVLHVLCTWKPIQEFIKHMDYQFYQNLVDVLIPDVLRPIPSTLTQAIRTFAKSLEGWLKAAMVDCNSDVINIKVSAISAFAQTLRRYTSLNHLAQAARAVLQSPTQIKQMTTDLNRVDFRSVQEQASWVCQCNDDTVQRLLSEFRQTLQHNLWLEAWASWLEGIVEAALKPHEGKPNYPRAARHFLLKWSFYSSLVIRDLTLRSAASFGSFHLLRLLYDEYMFYIIEHAIAKATGTTSIAVMGEYLCSGEPEELCNENNWIKHKNQQARFSNSDSSSDETSQQNSKKKRQ